jgi:hypothetical protein
VKAFVNTNVELSADGEDESDMVNRDFEPTTEEEAVLQVLKDEERANPFLIRNETGLGKGAVNTALTRLTSAGWVSKVTRGLYEYESDPRGPPERNPVGDASFPGNDEEGGVAESVTTDVSGPDLGPFADLDFPAGVDHDEAADAIYAAHDFIRDHDGATMREIVLAVSPDHPLKYGAVEELEEGKRYRGSWWRKVVKPGLSELPGVKKPGPGESEWRVVDDE